MKTITIKQPWAWAIVAGHKKIENRSWKTDWRGELVIIAGRAQDRIDYGRHFLDRHGIFMPAELIFGAAIGVVTLHDIVPPNELHDPFAEGPWCWLLKNPRKFKKSIPMRGHLALREFAPGKKGNR